MGAHWTLCLLLFALPAAAAPANPVTNGGFEEVRDDGTPADWEFVGQSLRIVEEGARTGRRCLRLERAAGQKGETGLNREWNIDSGEMGKMLTTLKGGLSFWYRIESSEGASLELLAIPMNADPKEKTGSPRVRFLAPEEHVGDGRWHEARIAYDFTADRLAKALHTAVRVTGGAGVCLIDDISWMERVGPRVSVGKVKLRPDAAQPGTRAHLVAALENLGDAPAEGITATLALPAGLSADAAERGVGQLPPGETAELTWTLTGERTGEQVVRVDVRAGEEGASGRVRIAPAPVLRLFLAEPFLVAPGGTAKVTAELENKGLSAATNVRVSLAAEGAVSLAGPAESVVERIAAGERRTLTWNVRAGRPGTGTVALRLDTGAAGTGAGGAGAAGTTVGAAGAEVPIGTVGPLAAAPRPGAPAAVAEFVVTAAVNGKPEPVAGPLFLRRAADRVIGEIRSPQGRTLAWLPALARVLYRAPDGRVREVLAGADTIERKGDEVGVLSTVADPEGGTWRFRIQAGRPEGGTLPVAWRVSCSAARGVLAFDGPMVYALGEMREAVVPGLEWMVAGELSNSDLDIKPGHADWPRAVAHPNKVTLPFMSVCTEGGVLGLLWDVAQKWDGTQDRPQPVFAAPDRLGGRAAHLMGLMVPTVATGVRPNERLADEPLALTAGKELALAARLLSLPGAGDALATQDAWFRHYRPAPVLPQPRGDYPREVAFSMRGFMESLWASPDEGWYNFLGGPKATRTTGHFSTYAYELMQAALALPGDPKSAAWRERAEEQLRRTGAVPSGADMGFTARDPLVAVDEAAGNAESMLASRRPDGTWRFDADRKDTVIFKGFDYHDLGEDDAVELGTLAQHAYVALRYCRLTGDRETYRALLPTLEKMTTFAVPRAAQVWEVPVHSPDILASADAIDAYLEAYAVSGEARWLAEARRQARAGVQFIYVWNDPRYPWMRYGSIPVIGASWHQWSWYGRVVQWNGLRYAYALLKLHDYDPKPAVLGGMTWRELARGITHSAMYQQSTEGENLALWPDALGCMDAGRANWEFSPGQILRNTWWLMGRPEEPRTVLLGQGSRAEPLTTPHIGGGTFGPDSPPDSGESVRFRRVPPAHDPVVAVSANADLIRAGWIGDRLSVNLRYLDNARGHVLVCGVTRPARVLLDSHIIPQNNEGTPLAGTAGASWKYSGAHSALRVRIPKDGAHEVVVEGVKSAPQPLIARRATEIRFEFAEGNEGWRPARDIEGMGTRDGALTFTTTGGDPYLIRSAMNVPAETVRKVRIRMQVGAGGGAGQFFFTTEAGPQFAEERSLRFEVVADGQWHEYVLDAAAHPQWRGTLTSVRLDPTGNKAGVSVAVDFVRGEQ